MDIRLIRSIRTHGAAHGPVAFSLAESFLSEFFRACPHLRAPLVGRRSDATRATAILWAWFIRNFGRLDEVQPRLDAISRRLSKAGFTAHDYRACRAALLRATQKVSGMNWNGQLEQDWNRAFDELGGRLSLHEPCAGALAA